MKEKDLIKDSSFELEYKFLAERMIAYGNTWLYSSHLYPNHLNSGNIEYHVSVFLSMLFPFLSPKGKRVSEFNTRVF